MMTSKERINATLAHKEADRIPVDFGATPTSGMHVSVVAQLRDHYELEKRSVKAHEPYQMLGLIEDDLKEILGIDTEGVFGRTNMYGFPNENWKSWRTPWGQEVLVPEKFNVTTDENGYTLIYPEGDLSAPASGKMPKSGFFFDTIIRQEPIDDDNLKPENNLEEFGLINEEDLNHFKREVDAVSNSGRAVVATFGGTAFGDIALVPAPQLKHPKGIRDITEWYISTVTRQNYIHAVFSQQCDIALANLQKIHSVVGNAVDVVFMCGTDFGTQTTQFCSTDTFKTLYAPYYKKINDWIHDHTTWKTFKHSCGSVEVFMPHFIEVGFDIINPVQCSATGMDPKKLKSRYGDRIVFWGGGVDTQRVLPFGTPDEVRQQVLERCKIFSKNGGFVFNTIHNVQAKTPIENLVALFNAIKEFNGERS